MPTSLIDSSRQGLRATVKKTKKKGSWLSRSRSGSRPQLNKKQRSLTNAVSSPHRVPSIQPPKQEIVNEETRDDVEGSRRIKDDSDELNNAPLSLSQLDDLDAEDEDDNGCNNRINIDESLHALSPFEAAFIDNTITKLHTLGYDNRGLDIHSLGMLLREICAWDKPFHSLQPPFDSLADREAPVSAIRHRQQQQQYRPKLNVDPLWNSLEHSLSLGGASSGGGNTLETASMTTGQMKHAIRSVLKEMNVKVTKAGTSEGRGGSTHRRNDMSWGNVPFMSIWDSLSYCQCSLY